jgi:uncharacterized membrane protein YphA (DoxX/SURF4 family)
MPGVGVAAAEGDARSEGSVIRVPGAVVWACAIFVAGAFVLVGVSKVDGASALRWTERFVHWGYPAGTQYVVGGLEILGGLGVLIPRWRRPAAATLVALMAGALCTHAVNAELPRLIPPLILGGLAFLLYRMGR